MFEVEGAERNAEAEGGGGNERVKKADAVRQVQAAEVPHGLERFSVGRPYEREGCRQPVNDDGLPRILSVLIQLHQNMARQGQYFFRDGDTPGNGGREPALEVNHHFRVEQAHSGSWHY